MQYKVEDSGLKIDEDKLLQRIRTLENLTQSTKYAKQKSSLENQLTAFLAALSPSKTIDDASPKDVRLFLAHKDFQGKTKVHKADCIGSEIQNNLKCECPTRRSAGSMDSLIGQIRAIFRDHGRGSEWFQALALGNPAAAPVVKQFLSAVRLEQSAAATIPKRAVPLFLDKLTFILRFLSYKACNPKLATHMKFVYLRDSAMLNIMAHTGDRAGDIGELCIQHVRQLPESGGIIFTLVKGKTIDIRDPRVMFIYSNPEKEFCPVKILKDYVNLCQKIIPNFTTGFLFRPLNSNNEPENKPFSSSALNSRLKQYLTTIHMFEGETAHSTRSGCALTLSWLGIDKEHIKSHVGWKSDKMFEHYTQDKNISLKSTSARCISSFNSEGFASKQIIKFRNFDDFKKIIE